MAALPDVEQLLRHLRDVHARALQTKEQIDLLWQRLDGGESVLAEIGTAQQRLDGETQELTALAARLEEMGVVLRDIATGLVDFPARADRTEFYLCWRFGEDGIQYWHGIDEGFSGRKPLWTMPGGRPHLA